MADDDSIMMDDESIITFISATDATPEQAKNYLQLADGDVERAVSLFFESGGDFSPQTNPASSTSTNARPIPTSSSRIDEYRAPIAPKREVLAGGGGFGHHDMYEHEFGIGPNPNVMRNVGIGRPAARQTVDPFRDYDREAAIVRGEEVRPAAGRAERLADMFRPPFDIMWRSSFKAARDQANEEKKWLMVTLQDPAEFSSQTQNRDVWSKESVKDLVRENFIFMLLTSESAAGQEHRQFYPFDSYPYIAILDPLTGERLKIWSERIEPDEFIIEVIDFLDSGGRVAAAKPKKKKKPLSELSEEEQLEAALRASLGQPLPGDDEDEDSTGFTAPPSTMNGQAPEPPSICISTSLHAVAAKARENGAPVTAFDAVSPIKRDEPTTGDITRVQIRCPNGDRVVRKFLKSDPVRHIFEYVKSSIPGGDKPFEIFNVRDPLSKKLDQTVHGANCVSAALTMDFL
ncbi:hypothetical protein SeMB42_g04652 [Synchytrium endobioticum]|uniref:UBX domain-containing protein n=1 Tax=Synchytrium endobioticum TaxID=286115 RepID=A0A507CX74_9FUNG|nr:hypothetical protein SeLEV6574_g06441 [Synchytrium endobioticum]TPX43641.1 hypothetical protein SeMB42_g04652 [Synchytrium endobioticum]